MGVRRSHGLRGPPDAPWPIKVVVADRLAPPAISPERPGHAAYRSAWIFVIDEGRPIGKLEVELHGVRVGEAEVAHLIDAHLGARGAERRHETTGGPLPLATVVLPTTGERVDELRSCLESLSKLDYPEYEVLVVDNRPRRQDGPAVERAVGSIPGVRVLAEGMSGVSAAKNRGLEEARGEVVAFCDDDIIVDRHWLAELIKPIASDPSISAVTGLVLPREIETDAQYWFEEYAGFGGGFEKRNYRPVVRRGSRRSHDLVRSVSYTDDGGRVLESLSLYSAAARCATGGSLAVRSQLLHDLGGFETSLGAGTRAGGGEDLAFFARLLMSGASVSYEPAAFSFHEHRRSYSDLSRQMRAWGRGLSAMLTSLTLDDPRHAPVIARRTLPALEHVVHRARRRGATAGHPTPTFPPQLRWYEISGMLVGPFAYLLERADHRLTGSQRDRP